MLFRSTQKTDCRISRRACEVLDVKIHTLGPKQTDSSEACDYYRNKNFPDAKIMLHQSFESILEHLEEYRGDLFVVPAAFASETLHLTWGTMHYRYLDRLDVEASFIYPLAEMVCIKSRKRHTGIGYTHAATKDLLKKYAPNARLVSAASKYRAYERYLKDGEYVLTNKKNMVETDEAEILAEFQVKMVWCVYRIK